MQLYVSMADALGIALALSTPFVGEHSLSRWSAVGLCGGMACMYVLILYLPPVILNLSPPRSMQEHLLRRFAFAFLASVASPVVCALVLPLQGRWKSDLAVKLRVFGVRFDHLGQAVLFPLLLTIILYLGPIVMGVFALFSEAPQERWSGTSARLGSLWWYLVNELKSAATDMISWRNYVVAPFSEELVFRACMVPVLLCGGFSTTAITFLCPLLFSFGEVLLDDFSFTPFRRTSISGTTSNARCSADFCCSAFVYHHLWLVCYILVLANRPSCGIPSSAYLLQFHGSTRLGRWSMLWKQNDSVLLRYRPRLLWPAAWAGDYALDVQQQIGGLPVLDWFLPVFIVRSLDRIHRRSTSAFLPGQTWCSRTASLRFYSTVTPKLLTRRNCSHVNVLASTSLPILILIAKSGSFYVQSRQQSSRIKLC